MNEPTFQFCDPQTNYDYNSGFLISSLDYYANRFSPDKSKEWALEWMSKVPEFKPEDIDVARKTESIKFSNRGFICRMGLRGYPLPKGVQNDLVYYLKHVKEMVVEEGDKPHPFAPRRNNVIIEQMQQALELKKLNTLDFSQADERMVKDASFWVYKQIHENPYNGRIHLNILRKAKIQINDCGVVNTFRDGVEVTNINPSTPTQPKLPKAPKQPRKTRTPSAPRIKADVNIDVNDYKTIDGKHTAIVIDIDYDLVWVYRSNGQPFKLDGMKVENLDRKASTVKWDTEWSKKFFTGMDFKDAFSEYLHIDKNERLKTPAMKLKDTKYLFIAAK